MLTSHEIEDILDRFREWLHSANEEMQQPGVAALAEQLADPRSINGEAAATKSAGLLQIVDAFTALRHEIKLQTKGLRGLQDDLRTNQQSVEHAVAELQANRRDTAKVADEAALNAARPLIMGLLDIDEAIDAAVKSTERAVKSRNQPHESTQSLIDELEQEFQRLPKWKRLWLKNYWQQVQRRLETLSEPTQGPTEILDGLRLLQNRLRHVLAEAEVEPTKCVGRRVEPRTMRVVEVVEAPDQPSETVVDEIRVGYQWKGITLRPAEVRATKSKSDRNEQGH